VPGRSVHPSVLRVDGGDCVFAGLIRSLCCPSKQTRSSDGMDVVCKSGIQAGDPSFRLTLDVAVDFSAVDIAVRVDL